mgnify:CR=1 FL=1
MGCVSEAADIIKINDINLYYKTHDWFPEHEVRLIYSDNELIEKKFLDVSKQLIAVILGHNAEDYKKTIISNVCKDNNIGKRSIPCTLTFKRPLTTVFLFSDVFWQL